MEKMKSFQEDIMLSDRSELDEKYFHKSHKGKKLSDAEPKKRGTPARKRGISGELICSLTGVSRDGAAFAEIHNMGKPSQDDVENGCFLSGHAGLSSCCFLRMILILDFNYKLSAPVSRLF